MSNVDEIDETKETPEHCPKCDIKLIFNGPGFGFCDNCSIVIESQ